MFFSFVIYPTSLQIFSGKEDRIEKVFVALVNQNFGSTAIEIGQKKVDFFIVLHERFFAQIKALELDIGPSDHVFVDVILVIELVFAAHFAAQENESVFVLRTHPKKLLPELVQVGF